MNGEIRIELFFFLIEGEKYTQTKIEGDRNKSLLWEQTKIDITR